MVYTAAIKLGPLGCKIFHYTGYDDKYEAISVKSNWTCLPLLDREEIINPLRSLGRSFDDPFVQEDIKKWPAQVINQNNKPLFQVGQKWNETTTTHTTEEIVSWILEAGKNRLEEKAGQSNYAAILIVPNDYNQIHQESMRIAIELSKIQVTKIISQATAVGYSFNALRNQINYKNESENIYNVSSAPPPKSGLYLFVHLGSYSLDVTVIEYDEENELIEIKSTSGDSHLGSIDFTRRMDLAVKEFCQEQNISCERNWIPWKIYLNLLEKNEVRMIPLQYKDMQLQWKRESLEKTILQLERSLEHAFDPQFVCRKLNKKEKKLKQLGPIDSSRCYQLTQEKFEQQCRDLFNRVAQQVEIVVKEAGTGSSYAGCKLYGGGAISWPKITDIVCRILPNISVDYDKVPEDLDSPDSCSFLSSTGQVSYDLLGAACLAHVMENDNQKTDRSQNNFEQLNETNTVSSRKARLIYRNMELNNCQPTIR